MLNLRIGYQKEAPRPWYLEYEDKGGAWHELIDSRINQKQVAATLLNVATQVAIVCSNNP
jgi:hypothetical protein